MEQNKIPSFEQLPQMVAELTEKINDLQAAMASFLSVSSNYPKSSDRVTQHLICDIDRASELTHKAKSTLYRIARAGEMPCIKNGKNWYFFEDELMTWLEHGRHHYSLYNSEEELRKIQSAIHHKPKALVSKKGGLL